MDGHVFSDCIYCLLVQVALVAFSDTANAPLGTDNDRQCYSKQLAQATPQNRLYLKSYIDTLTADGGTAYGQAFRVAFDFFHDSNDRPAYDDRPRGKVYLFCTKL